MNIYQIAEQTGVSLRILKKLEKLGYLNVSETENPTVEKIRQNLRRRNPLSAEQQLYLLKNPSAMEFLEDWDYVIEDYLNLLGNVIEERMPWRTAASIVSSGDNDKEATGRVAAWICDFIDQNSAFAKGATCEHTYLAVRMLADIPDNLLHMSVTTIRQAMKNCRRTKIMKGYWHTDPVKKRTIYHRPTMMFDL